MSSWVEAPDELVDALELIVAAWHTREEGPRSTPPRPMDVSAFARAVRAYCAKTGASVTSWGRTPSHNRAVGGQEHSRHLEFMAVDVVYDQEVPGPDALHLAQQEGLQVYRERDHDHLSPAGGPV